ncbi:MAG: SulP family inorganic anion transporter, partial [Cyclobacteriaceae bacterium]|nr:SulP family inorganic anion transporter [Cyclobacteriaceae bacterium]
VMVTLFSVLMDFDIPRIGDIPIGIPEVYFSEIFSVQWSQWSVVLQFGATLAALGAIDSLLTSVVADNITKTTHNSNRELIGQGLGNMTAAIIGGLPGAGATMRTVINVNSGGKTRLSGVFHALLLLVVLLGAGKYAALIPKSVLAGILISVGIGIIDYKGFRHLFRVPKSDAVVLVIVLLITIFGNLLNAVAVGMVLASVLFMKKTGDISADKSVVASLGNFERDLPWPDEVELDQKYHNKVFVKHLYGSLFFGFTSKFKEMMNSIPEVELVVFRMDRVPYLDQSGLYALEDVITNLKNKGIRVIFSGLEEQPKDMLSNIKIIPDLVPQTQVFSSIKECSDWIKLNIN